MHCHNRFAGCWVCGQRSSTSIGNLLPEPVRSDTPSADRQAKLVAIVFHPTDEGDETMKQPVTKSAILLALCVAMSWTSGRAAEQLMDMTYCVSGTSDVLAQGEGFLALASEDKGIGWSNTDNKTLENSTIRCISVFGIVSGDKPLNGYCKHMDSDGDYFVMDLSRTGPVSAGRT